MLRSSTTGHLAAPRPGRRRFALAAGSAVLFGALALIAGPGWLHRAAAAPPAPPQSDDPNVIFILTDDQTVQEMRGLPQTTSLIGGGGVTFKRSYASFPLCCPARATLLSGQYEHNHDVRGNNPPFGGWTRFSQLGTEAKALPVWLQAAGYYTVHVGKYLNGYNGGNPPIPVGYDEFYGKLAEFDSLALGNRVYYNYRVREDPPADGGVPCPSGNGGAAPGQPFTCSYGSTADEYQTDVLRNQAVEAIHRLSGPVNPQTPFYLSVGFSAPHAPHIAAPRHLGAFAGSRVKKPKGFNEKDRSDKPGFISKQPALGKKAEKKIANRRRARLEQLLSVDDAVSAIFQALAQEGELDDTYVIFTSDNGYYNGEHGLSRGKYLPHEPSSRVPLLIRGPAGSGVSSASTSNELISNVDIAATIADIAGASPQLPVDGRSLLPFARNPSLTSTRPLLLEADTGPGIDDEGTETPPSADATAAQAAVARLKGVKNLEQEPTARAAKKRRVPAPAYKALRTNRYLVVLYGRGRAELYDMKKDPAQLRSVRRDPRYDRVWDWLLVKLARFADCFGTGCNAQIGVEPRPAKGKEQEPKNGKKGNGKGKKPK